MKKLAPVLLALLLSHASLFSGDDPKFDFSKKGGYRKAAVPTAWTKSIRQGFGMSVIMSNEAILGNQAISDVNAIGWDYPAGSRTEHLFGGGPCIGGIWNGQRRVSAAYWEGTQEFKPEITDSARDRLWIAVASDTLYDPNRPGYYKRGMSVRGVDDDNDGKIDEDELDGLDNDGDWNALTDDIGADGLPDSLEVGCRGAYDPVTNPDPAFDNYFPLGQDLCHQNPDGSTPRKNDKDKYTEKNGLPDHGEPHVDEDYGAVSDHDVYFATTDTFKVPAIGSLLPLGVKIWARSYAWQGKTFEAILPIDYYFINVGKYTIHDVYLGWTADPDVGPVSDGTYATSNYSGYIPELHTAYVHNPVARGATPMGIAFLGSSRPLDSLQFTYQWYPAGSPITGDSLEYGWMDCSAFGGNCILPNQSPATLQDMRVFMFCGPFADLAPGDTVRLSTALVSGNGIDAGVNPLTDNVKTAIKAYTAGYRQPAQPISPCLEATPGYKKVTLRWGRNAICQNGRPSADPMGVWDDSNKVAESFPPDHWRRINPPSGHTRGGRTFEGYRLYRSEDPSGATNSFTLLKQFDLDDEFSFNTGLDTTYVDSNLVRGKRYWYSVTSFGIRDRAIITSIPSPGVVVYDTLYTGETESPFESNYQAVDLSFSVASRPDEVLVVPNPYRSDVDYTLESGGWEGRSRDWTENNRKLKFIHLPKKCTIRIFTLAGDIVSTIEHDDPVKGEVEWDLLSDGHRALASGVYIFSVESDLGKQIGKFVLIR
ncbi:MAG TPA: hypothetical protein VL633_02770 [Bacteroidota bacterium]|jgi:hypothetical protein|nr:hypothetical protein [Bacteroidota bacterium]